MKAKYPPTTDNKMKANESCLFFGLETIGLSSLTWQRKVRHGVRQTELPTHHQHRPQARRAESQQHNGGGHDSRHHLRVVDVAALRQYGGSDVLSHGSQEDDAGILDLANRERQRRKDGEADLVHRRAPDDKLAQAVQVRLEDGVAENDGGVAVEARHAHDAVHQGIDDVVGETCPQSQM